MDRLPRITIALAAPLMIFVLLVAVSSTLFSTTRVPVAPPASATSADDDQVAQDETETTEVATETETTEVAAEAEETPAAEADVATEATAGEAAVEEEVAEATEEAPTETQAEDAQVETAEAETTEVAAADSAVEDTAGSGEAADIDLAALVAAGDPRAGARLWRQCSACHVADQEQNRVGPHLVGVLGRPVGNVDGFRYSGALEEHGAPVWTAEEMSAWLENPRDYAPGTSMSYRGLSDPEDRANILSYLADLQVQSGS